MGGAARLWLSLGLGAVLLVWPQPAAAHSRLVGSDPSGNSAQVLTSPPAAVRLWFSEPVVPAGVGVTVIAPSGRPVQRGPATAARDTLSVPVAATEAGTYLVRWQVIAADTHPARGTFTFSVGHTSAVPPAGTGDVPAWAVGLQALARWLHVLGYALTFGPVAFAALLPTAGASRLWRLSHAGLGLLLLAAPMAVLGQMVSLSPSGPFDAGLLTDVMASSFGRLISLRLGATLLFWAVLSPLQHARGRGLWPGLAIGLAVAVVDSAASHTTRFALPGLGRALATLHLAAMGTWAGGLGALLLAWPAVPPAERRPLLAGFGRLATAALAVILGTGGLLALGQLSAWRQLVDNPYGGVLLAKVGVVGVVLLLAVAGRRSAGGGGWWRREALALGAVLALAALMAALPPPR